MSAYPQKIAPLFRQPPDVFFGERAIKSLEPENARLKGRLAHQLDRLAIILKEERESGGLSRRGRGHRASSAAADSRQFGAARA
jgi:hypothetical protein